MGCGYVNGSPFQQPNFMHMLMNVRANNCQLFNPLKIEIHRNKLCLNNKYQLVSTV
jgi:hypothetical protein